MQFIDFLPPKSFFMKMKSNHSWVESLNPQQKKAALHDKGPLLILAGAGSGKTTVLVARTGRLIDEKIVSAEEVLVLTFTNKAARELKERVAQKLGAQGKHIWAGTFHSFGLSLLKEHHEKAGLPKRFAIIDATDARGLVRDILKDIVHGEKESFDPELILGIMGRMREKLKPLVSSHPNDVEMAQIILPKYLAQLKMWGAVDFDGLLLEPLRLLKAFPEIQQKCHQKFQQVMVDEFQDTNRVQMQLIEAILGPHNNLTVVGDDDQSIYGWRGAVITHILKFPQKFKNCEVVPLEINYRSTPAILNVANTVIAKNKKRHAKTLRSHENKIEGAAPEVFTYDTDDEEIEEIISQIKHFQGKGFQNNEIAILFRSNSQGGLLEGTLRKNNIDYTLSGGMGFFDRKEVRDIFAYMRAAMTPSDMSLRRILNTPSRGIGKQSFQHLEDWTKENSESFYQSLKNWKQAGVSAAAGGHIEEFLKVLSELRALLQTSQSVEYSEELPKFFDKIGYKTAVFKTYKDGATAGKKWQLVEIMGRIYDGFVVRNGRGIQALSKFVESMELRDAPEEDTSEAAKEKVQLLTLHACKGLEFPVVIMIGIEEGLLPHETLGGDIDEERRLFYVGVTRAQKNLVLTHSKKRKRYGKWRLMTSSRFLIEIPNELTLSYPAGIRPLGEKGRRSLLDDLYAKLDQKSRGPDS